MSEMLTAIVPALMTCIATVITTIALIRYYTRKDKNDKQVNLVVSI